VPKRKIFKYNDIYTFPNVLQPGLLKKPDRYKYYHHWAEKYFHNANPVVLELGCGRAEYTVSLAAKYPSSNFIGMGIKGDRIWMGASKAMEARLTNLCFIRTRIESIDCFFAENEISEIWITFPDPQPNKEKKRLTSPLFLSKYAGMLTKNHLIHLKTDNKSLFDYTLEVIHTYQHRLHFVTHDLHQSDFKSDAKEIITYYESMFLKKNLPIYYLNFSLNPSL